MLQLQSLDAPAALADVIRQGDHDKLFLAAMDFIDGYQGLEPEARMCWLYLFTDYHRGREFKIATLAKKICCPVAIRSSIWPVWNAPAWCVLNIRSGSSSRGR